MSKNVVDKQKTRPRGLSADVYERLKKQDLLYHKILETTEDGILIMRGSVIVDANAKVEEIIGIDRSEVIGKSPWQLGTPTPENSRNAADAGESFVRRAYAGEPLQFVWEYKSVKGSCKAYEMTMARFDLEDGPRLLCSITEATEALASQRQLKARNRFQETLEAIYRQLLAASVDDLPKLVRQSFEQICEQYRLERASVVWMKFDTHTAYACRPVGQEEYQTDFSIDMIDRHFWRIPWMLKRIEKSDFGVLFLPQELPEEAIEDRAYFEEFGISSQMFVALPGRSGEAGAAAVGVLSDKRAWTADERSELQMLLQVVGFAWERYVQHYLTTLKERDLARSQRVAGLGSYQFQPAGPGPFSWDNARIDQSEQADRLRAMRTDRPLKEQMLDRVHADDRERVANALRSFNALEKSSPLAYRLQLPDGTVHNVEERFEVDRDDDGMIERIFGTIMDVTSQVEVTDKLIAALKENDRLRARLQAENVALRDEVRAVRGFERIIGRSAALRRTLAQAEQVASTDVPVLLLGETGTGKELLARSIHGISGRRDGPLVCVNCAVISTELIESELFGHEKGAFTDAVSSRSGRFELADGGTLFLDEIGELPLEIQAKLLRVLQSGEVERLGSSETRIVDVRLIAATNRDLESMVAAREFRDDLMYRINQFPITLPPLRERREDIPALSIHLLEKHAKKLGKRFTGITPAMLDALSIRPWPGNVRELEGCLQREMISSDGPVLDLPLGTGRRSGGAGLTAPPPTATDPQPADDGDLRLDNMLRKHITEALEHCNWMVDGDQGAATLLKLPPSSLRSKMKRLGIARPD